MACTVTAAEPHGKCAGCCRSRTEHFSRQHGISSSAARSPGSHSAAAEGGQTPDLIHGAVEPANCFFTGS